ncbi:MAG: hypothetical protein ACOYN0_01745 [Phycisphaerales bacterium]
MLRVTKAAVLAVLAGTLAASGPCFAQSSGGNSAFTYQGEATDAVGAPLSGPGQVRFRLYTADLAGTWVNNVELTVDVVFDQGRFTAAGLDFGPNAYGTGNEPRWLQIAVREPGGANFTTLSPRQRLSQAPFAAVAGKALQMDATGLSGVLASGFVTSNGLMTATSTQTVSGAKTFNNAANVFVGNGSGLTGVTAASYNGAIVDGQLSTNAALLNRANQVFSQTNRFSQNIHVDGRVGVGTTSPSAPVHVLANQQQALNLVSSSTGGTWIDLSNTSVNGRTWSFISSGSGNTEGAGQLLVRNSTGSTIPFMINGNSGAVGIGTTTPGAGTIVGQAFDKLEVSGPDVGVRVRNVNDSVGGVVWNSFGAFHFGMYNPTALLVGQVPSLSRRAFFSVSNDGRVGSTTNTGGNPIFRNFLDDGNGNFIVRANGSLSGNHVALFENTGAADADGIAIKINNAETNRNNHFVTFYNGLGNITGRIEGFDFNNFDWVAPPPGVTFNLRPNIVFNPASSWFSRGSFSAGTLPTLGQTQAPVSPSLSWNTINIAGQSVITPPLNFNSGSPALYGLSGGVLPSMTLPSITGNPIAIGNPGVLFDLPTQQQMNDLVCWGLEFDVIETIGAIEQAAALAVLRTQALQNCKDGGVTYGSKGADYAEYLERSNPNERINWGEVVGVRAGKISRITAGAEQVMVVSRAPIVLGNQPANGDVSRCEKVAFMGQVPVLVRGSVNAGDYIVASGLNDGSAVAVPAERLEMDHLARLVGRAWEGAPSGSPINLVNTAIGVNQQAARHVIERQARELQTMKRQFDASREDNRTLESRVAAIEQALRLGK